LTTGIREGLAGRDVIADFLQTLPPEFPCWSHLAQDQYIEVRTLLSGYLLSSQGDRMLMGHSVEGRFPFLDKNVVALADSLPASFKLKVLDEKHVLKRASRDLVPEGVISRRKQPYRVPDAVSFMGEDLPDYVDDLLDGSSLLRVGVFNPGMISQLRTKLDRRRSGTPPSNTDNMALVGVLSTQLLHHQFIRNRPRGQSPITLTTDVDRIRESESRT